LIVEIAYHGFLVELPMQAVAGVMAGETPELVLSDRIMFFRPKAQSITDGVNEADVLPQVPAAGASDRLPIVALLDGLPLQNHAQLQGRLLVDDPDGWEGSYAAKDRVHGTAMASLILHGELDGVDCAGLLRPTQGTPALDPARARARRSTRIWHAIREPGNRAVHAQKNDLKPWRRVMWCIGALTEEYRGRMYALLELYARPLSKTEPVICIDEKSLQLISHSRAPLAMTPSKPVKQDYEYVRNGTTNLFVAVEPKAGRIHLVLDNLNTHFRKCFDDVLGSHAAAKLLRRVEFHYTPKHASWLNMAEIEIGILSRQCLDQRMANREFLASEVAAWQKARNEERRVIEWRFTRQDADLKLGPHYVSKLAC
jgi:hypothetical protein